MCAVCAATSESLHQETAFFGIQAHLQNICQGHQAKVKVTKAKTVSVCPAWVLPVTFECFDLETSFFGRQEHLSSA